MSWIRKLFGGSASADSPPQPIRIEIPPPEGEEGEVRGDQLLRKLWAEDLLRAEGIPINSHLPFVESEAEIEPRSAREVAERLLALTIVAMKGEGMAADQVDEIVRQRDARGFFTPKELAFIENRDPSLHDRTQFSWRYEAAWVLLWALNLVDGQLGLPRDVCDVGFLVGTVRDAEDLTAAELRPMNDILNETDLIYRCHWAVVQARLDGDPSPAGLEPGVTMERHKALNWLVRYFDAEWDDVTTDT